MNFKSIIIALVTLFGLNSFDNGKLLEEKDILDTNKIVSLIKEDSNKLGFVFEKIDSNIACPEGCYKVAFVIDNQYQYGDSFKYDYHWYRQNSDGTWSHKPGSTNVTKLDYSKKNYL